MDNPTIINVGNDRPNIMYKIEKLNGAASSCEDLRFLADNIRTIVYFETRRDAEDAGDKLRSWFGPNKVHAYHGFKTDRLKNERMKAFKAGEFNILLATEAAGMGCDISDIVRVVQYGFPKDLNSLVQRLGRAARDSRLQG
ncbi:hypothetical protein BG000_006180, partial [Podila horticola]